MQILTTVEALRAWRKQAGTLAFVPTMGNLHAGHIQLCHTAIERMRAVGGKVIVSIFVNPIQIGPGEDLDSYPRTFEADCEKLQAAGVDAVFHPSCRSSTRKASSSISSNRQRSRTCSAASSVPAISVASPPS